MPAGAMRIMVGPTNRRLTGSPTLARLCDLLSNLLDRPVVDLTGLTGAYAIDLSWTPDENELMGGGLSMGMAVARAGAGAPPEGRGGGDGNAASDPGLTLAQALQTNYGLKLEAKKNPPRKSRRRTKCWISKGHASAPLRSRLGKRARFGKRPLTEARP
jgi:uncharacterized protein (TIGR03435 family)